MGKQPFIVFMVTVSIAVSLLSPNQILTPAAQPTLAAEANYFDDFSSYTPGFPPTGWLLRGADQVTPTVEEIGGTGPSYHLVDFPEVPWQYWDRWLLKDGLTLSSFYTVTVKLNFQNSVADRAGLTIAWNDANSNRIDIQPNVYGDDIEFRVTYNGPIQSNVVVNNVGYIPINAFTDYWLRVVAKNYGPGRGQVLVFWSTDNTSFTQVVTATGLQDLTGSAGISTAGPHLPHMYFDDFSVEVGSLEIVDLGLRPNLNGYSFPNYGDFYIPYSDGDYSKADMELMFGSNAVCSAKIGPVCILKLEAARWHNKVNSDMSGGHCYGMAVESLRFFKTLDQPSLYQSGANTTFDLTKDNAKRRIAYFFVEQFTDPAMSYLNQSLQNTPAVILNQLRTALQSASDPPILVIIAPNREGGHAITPYKIEPHDNGVFWIRVYDNNYPSDDNRYVVIDTVTNTWSYNLGGSLGTWSGAATTQSLGLVPTSLHSEIISTCPWCSSTNLSAASSSAQLWSNGDGNLLITDDQGRRMGFSNNQFTNEIPNAYSHPVLGGLTADTEPIYALPLSGNYTILLDGNPLTQAKNMEVTQFGPGYAVSVDDVVLKPATQDQLTIKSNGTQVTYSVSETKAVTLSLALEGTNNSTLFQLQGVDIGASQSVRATVDASQGKLAFSNAQAGGGAYNLKIERASAVGTQTFTHGTVSILAGDTQYVNYGAWNGSDSIVLEVDHGSNGTIDQTIVLDNEVKEIYLPFIRR